jgi:DNA-binding transcriptional ArsR family regulator
MSINHMEMSTDEMDLVLSALAHETRRSVVRALSSSGTMTFSEMMQAAGSSETGTFGFHFKKLLPLLDKEQDGGYRLSKLGFIASGILGGLRSDVVKPVEPQGTSNHVSSGEIRDEVECIRGLDVAWLNKDRLQKSKGVVVRDCINVLIDQDVDEQTAREKILLLSDIVRIDIPKYLTPIILSRLEREVSRIVRYEGAISIDAYFDNVLKTHKDSTGLDFFDEGVLSAKDLQTPKRIENFGFLRVMDDVTPELVQSNVLELNNYGDISCPNGLKEALSKKVIDDYGSIQER